MDRNWIDSAIEQLSELLSLPQLTVHMKQQIQTLQLDLRFLKMFCCCLAKWKVDDKDMHLGSFCIGLDSTPEASGKGLYDAGYFAIIGKDFKFWDLVTSNLLKKVGNFKSQIREVSVALSEFSSQFKSSTTDEILELIGVIIMNLNDLVSLKAALIVPVKKQIEALIEKLKFSRDFVGVIVKRCAKHDKMEDFFIQIQDLGKNSACLSFLYWVDNMDEHMAAQMNAMLLKIMPYTPTVSVMYLELLIASKSPKSESLFTGKIVARYVDFLLGNLVDSLKDHRANLREGLLFLITFLVDPPEELARETGSVSWTRVDTVNILVESLICWLYTDQQEDNTSEKRCILLCDLLEKIEKVKAEVRELCLNIPNSAESNFPQTNGIGYINFLAGNLRDLMQCKVSFVPFADDKVMRVHEELLRFRLFLQDVMDLQNDYEELKALSMRIINLAYQVECAINSCSIEDIPTWYHIICFYVILEDIGMVKTEVTKMKKTYNIEKHIANISSKHVHPSRANTSKIDETVVGFTDEANEIINLLTNGSKKVEIVSIVGLPGVGKTTLAKKVYNDPSIACNFHKHAWCFVSQAYTSRDILLSIFRSVSVGIDDAQISKMSNEDVAEQLRKCLKRQKYLVVMDNIWDIEAWKIVKYSLPDDENESRIMFTTQNKNLIVDVEQKSSNYPLSPLIGDKSWLFLREKLFSKDDCPQELLKIGKQIVRHCEGLPLAISVIAGLLAKEKDNLEWWKLVEASLNSDSTAGGYMGTLELSYKHLIDSLKPCFLYFGAFQKGEVISAKKLTLLWNAEGFIRGTKTTSFENVAKECLTELIDRSLVIVAKRSSNGGVKSCRVHDLLHKLCSEKAKQENFLHVMERSDDSRDVFNQIKHDQYRLCVHTAEWETFSSKPNCPGVRSLLFFCDTIKRHTSSASSGYFNSFKLLKVLNLERVCLNCPFPEEIIAMIHLRYLGIWGFIKEVPASIDTLLNLETFIVKGMESFIHLPDTMWKMRSLRHVDVSEMAVISSGDYEGEETDVETFSLLSLSDGGDAEKLLRRLTKLRKLRCAFVESRNNRRKGVQFPTLAFLEDLESLKISTHGSHEQVFYSWMRIQFQAFNLPSNLKKLTLYNFGLPWKAISTIGKLPHLEVLKLRQKALSGQRWDVEDEQFTKLKFLELSDLDIVLWKASSDSFPCLERLVIEDCYELEEIPFSFADIFNLKVIQLRRCDYDIEHSAQQIFKEQQDMGNEEFQVVILH